MPLPERSVVDSYEPDGKYVTYDIKTDLITEKEASIQIGDLSQETLPHPGIAPLAKIIEPQNFSSLMYVPNPEDWPWSPNVKLFGKRSNGISYSCSGTLIDAKHVITAGHCVYKLSEGGWATEIRVVPAYQNGHEPYDYSYAVQLHSWSGWVIDMDFDFDQGVIDLDRPIGALTGWYGYWYDNNCSFYTNNIFYNPGYPSNYPYNGQYMYYWYGTFDGTPCNSGSWYGTQIWFNREAKVKMGFLDQCFINF